MNRPSKKKPDPIKLISWEKSEADIIYYGDKICDDSMINAMKKLNKYNFGYMRWSAKSIKKIKYSTPKCYMHMDWD